MKWTQIYLIRLNKKIYRPNTTAIDIRRNCHYDFGFLSKIDPQRSYPYCLEGVYIKCITLQKETRLRYQFQVCMSSFQFLTVKQKLNLNIFIVRQNTLETFLLGLVPLLKHLFEH